MDRDPFLRREDNARKNVWLVVPERKKCYRASMSRYILPSNLWVINYSERMIFVYDCWPCRKCFFAYHWTSWEYNERIFLTSIWGVRYFNDISQLLRMKNRVPTWSSRLIVILPECSTSSRIRTLRPFFCSNIGRCCIENPRKRSKRFRTTLDFLLRFFNLRQNQNS